MDIRAFINTEPKGDAAVWSSTTDLRAGGCEMTPGLEPLQCRCGDHSAKYVPAKKKQPPRWMVTAVKVQGKKPRPVTTVANKEKALERVRAECAPSLTHPTTAQTEVLATAMPRS
jgi:predicted RNA-binding protein with PUA-like domain